MEVTAYADWDGSIPAVVAGMPEDAYHAHDSVSKSGLDLINMSPAHYYWSAKREPTRAMDIGTAIHTALLEPERFAAEYVLLDGVKDRRASEYKEACKAHDASRVLVSKEAANVAGMQETVRSDQYIRDMLDADGHREVSVFARDPETGAAVRCRFDLLALAGWGLDLKKTRDARSREFERAVARYRYHVQVAFYSDVLEWATGERLTSMPLLAVEEEPPHTAVPYILGDMSIEQGRREYRRNLDTYAACVKAGEWPGYKPDSYIIDVPDWALDDIEEEVY